MLEPLDRYRRDSTLFQFTTKRLRDFIDPAHLLIQIDEKVDFAKLVEPLERNYSIDNGRPAIHPEVLVRAMLISALYNITSFRRLCLAISENIAFRWFCFLTIDDEVFDHSTITYFIERIGREGFKALFASFNQELLRMRLLSPKMYADSTLVKANVCGRELFPSGMTVEEFQEKAVKENGLFIVKEIKRGEGGLLREETKYYQDARGRVPLSPVDLDARWRTHCHSEPTKLCYLENAIADESGFIIARSATRASEAEWKMIPKLLGELPIAPESLAADSSYSAGELRKHLRDQDIIAYIPFSSVQKRGITSRQDFEYYEEYLICPEGKKLKRGRFYPQDNTFKYGASQKNCRACPRKETCLWPSERRHRIRVSAYYPEIQRAAELNKTPAYGEEIKKRKTIIEGVFACQDRLGWSRCKLRGLWKVDCEGFLAALAHNILKLVRKLKARLGIPVCYGRQGMEAEGVLTY
jgi:transposase